MDSPKSRKVLPHMESGSGSCRQMRLHAPSSNAENNKRVSLRCKSLLL